MGFSAEHGAQEARFQFGHGMESAQPEGEEGEVSDALDTFSNIQERGVCLTAYLKAPEAILHILGKKSVDTKTKEAREDQSSNAKKCCSKSTAGNISHIASRFQSSVSTSFCFGVS